MENFFHELVHQTSQKRVVECWGLGSYPFMEVSKKLICPKGFTLFELFDP